METFSALLAICADNSPVPGEFSAQGPVTRSFYAFFYLHLNKRVNHREAGESRRHRAHYDAIVRVSHFQALAYNGINESNLWSNFTPLKILYYMVDKYAKRQKYAEVRTPLCKCGK